MRQVQLGEQLLCEPRFTTCHPEQGIPQNQQQKKTKTLCYALLLQTRHKRQVQVLQQLVCEPRFTCMRLSLDQWFRYY